MEFLNEFLDLFRNLPETLRGWVEAYGLWTYAILFLIVFVETGVVVMPFLPGDSLLFAVGAIAKLGVINFWTAALVIFVAAVVGDAANYHIGKFLAPKLAGGKSFRLINQKHLDRTHEFFEKYGGKTIILARFVPIVRTFAPFVAGMGAMTYSKFLFYNVIGAAAWVAICMGAGWVFGGIEAVQKNFELVIIGIIVVSVIPMVVEYVLARRRAKAARTALQKDVRTP